MSLKRPLSPESNNDLIHNDTRQLKRLKLHSIIQQLRNEEAKLILLKKLRTNQQLTTRTTKSSTTITNGFHPTATRLTTTSAIPSIKPITNIPSQQPPIPPVVITHKTSNSSLLTSSNKTSSHHSFEERKNQAKLALNKQIERDLLSIPPPKPSLQDIPFIPNGNSLEFPPLIGLEDVIQCLNELQNDRHRLPQRFTDHASIDNPYICDQCGTDFTIRWWKHINTKSSNEIINILCDRCKKQILRRTSKSKHSTLLKNVFLSGVKQEKEIEKNFHSLIKQEKQSSRSKSSITTNPPSIQSMIPTPNYIPSSHQQYQIKNSLPQHFATKISQQSTRKSNGAIVQSQNHHSRTVQHNKTSMPIHHHHQQQQQYRSITALPQQTKINQMIKPSKTSLKQQTILPSARSIFPSNPDLIHAFLSSNLVRPTATKRRTVPTVELK
jgi:hypothetical protein